MLRSGRRGRGQQRRGQGQQVRAQGQAHAQPSEIIEHEQGELDQIPQLRPRRNAPIPARYRERDQQPRQQQSRNAPEQQPAVRPIEQEQQPRKRREMEREGDVERMEEQQEEENDYTLEEEDPPVNESPLKTTSRIFFACCSNKLSSRLKCSKCSLQ